MNQPLWPRLVLLWVTCVAAACAPTTAVATVQTEEMHVSHLYCQPLSEAVPATPMMGRFALADVSGQLDGKRVRVVDAPWPSIVGREFWLDTSWDEHWFLFHDDSALQVAGRPSEQDVVERSDRGLVEGRRVATVRILE
ncbi:hypothetical protein TraAM80_08116 [Trypanosoma rangeli]|uniref:Uncharacterized protein n=1 Tax=Trypanosoma rangeli TaxID=5698 RepID=A0A422N2E6_TRYRA|nr:uncharacterized protein TraAM80_08116 [Trypanosoma rangeli]RNE99642.1 hypothetical protein TraAM80_08116 [Trypanosoma rangeli]|eukprot:RNE99642.1 hypothetical protein TraAM80_08116 [Trypanosoma rangeli]